MHIRLIIVGDQGPIWVQTVFKSYVQRLPPQWDFKCRIIKGEKQTKNRNSKSIIDLEGKKILAEVKKTEEIIILDESGSEFTSLELSEKLNNWQLSGRNLCFIIGGPNGLSEACFKRANFCWSLSKLTLPHIFVRIIFIEQLYRIYTLNSGHPYHRN
jgi:23S rRNA (pseudouridine1915-N3)-methyltransferase|tara:strand:- start:240 stop:710 length:471 start_codon:yes stop_codon:yes gene_type:complete